MKVTVGTKNDLEDWIEVRNELWPAEDVGSHKIELEGFLESENFISFLAKNSDNQVVGFLEAFIRPFANGCEGRPVMFLEGIWVAPDFRNKQVGSQLLSQLEKVTKEKGLSEIGSDCDISNQVSQLVHQKWGFKETERVIYYRKNLSP